jgi:molybdenum cofactor cytidylyltransferase
MSTGIIILAAGGSERMGEPKQLLPFHDTTLLRHAVETAKAVPDAPVVVVLGAHLDALREHLAGTGVIIAENPDWRTGMGRSIVAGLSAMMATHPDVSSVIFMLCDQPLLSAETLDALIAGHRESGRALVASEYRGALGVPALFARSMFPELLTLAGTSGAQPMIEANRNQALAVPFPDGALDIDTPADYAQLANS